MKLWQDKPVVDALREILKENYSFLEYSEEDSKKGKFHEDYGLTEGGLYVKVNCMSAERDISDIDTICRKLAKLTKCQYYCGVIVNGGPDVSTEWTFFVIRRNDV